jgi:hypothetical protein
LPVSDELTVCALSLLGELALTPADFFERVCSSFAFLTATGGHPRAQFERAELFVGQ